ncbi:MAG TPA: protease [Saprospirales bacterium]|nr:protease [Saprospirales bacterium]
MKKRFLTLAAFALLFAGLNSCSKNEPVTLLQNGLSPDLEAQITALGFDASDAYATEGGYIVEGDIFLSDEDLNKPMDLLHSLLVGEEEQYHTTNLVTGLPREITIRVVSTMPNSIHTATTNAINRYNAEGLQLTFRKVTSGGNIVIKKAPNGAQYIASAGFPSGGNPYGTIMFNNNYSGWNSNTLTSIIAHEIGHCIGYRHTDYADRSYSCGGAPFNEGDGGVGAIHIPGTPTGPDAASWMLACIGNGTNRPFNANDKTALSTLY